MDSFDLVAARVGGSGSLPDALAVAFDGFESILLAAHDCEDQAPHLFPAFMMAAGAAAEGRNALAGAPSLPPPGRKAAAGASPAAASAGADQIADDLAALATVLEQQLARVAAAATVAGDRIACEQAAEAAGNIRRLLSRASHETAAG